MPDTTIARVEAGSFLTLHYRLSGPAGDIINTFNDKPATLSLGTGELSPAVEQRLLGLAEGTRTSFDLPAGEAFGERNADMQQWVARALLHKLGDPLEKYAVGDVVQHDHVQRRQVFQPGGTHAVRDPAVEGVARDDEAVFKLAHFGAALGHQVRG